MNIETKEILGEPLGRTRRSLLSQTERLFAFSLPLDSPSSPLTSTNQRLQTPLPIMLRRVRSSSTERLGVT